MGALSPKHFQTNSSTRIHYSAAAAFFPSQQNRILNVHFIAANIYSLIGEFHVWYKKQRLSCASMEKCSRLPTTTCYDAWYRAIKNKQIPVQTTQFYCATPPTTFHTDRQRQSWCCQELEFYNLNSYLTGVIYKRLGRFDQCEESTVYTILVPQNFLLLDNNNRYLQ